MTLPQASYDQHLPLLHPRQRMRKRVTALNHLVPAGMLVQGAIMAYVDGEPEWMRAVEFCVGAAYITLFVREWKRLKHSQTVHHAGPEWLELAAASIAWLEGFHIWHAHHAAEQISGRHSLHLLPWLYGLIGLVYAMLALNAGKLQGRQGLRIDNAGFSLRLSPIAPARSFVWKKVGKIIPAENNIDLHVYPAAGGSPQVLKLAAYSNAEELSNAIRSSATTFLDS